MHITQDAEPLDRERLFDDRRLEPLLTTPYCVVRGLIRRPERKFSDKQYTQVMF